ELEVQLGLRPPVIPVGELAECVPAERPLRQVRAAERNADASRLPLDPRLPRDRLRRRDDGARHQPGAALRLAGEYIDHVPGRNVLAAIHRPLRIEGESGRARIAHLGLDHVGHDRLYAARWKSQTPASTSTMPPIRHGLRPWLA